MNLLTAASAVDGHVVGDDAVFEQVVTDTRELSGGELFIALQGKRYDGRDFAQDAKRSGAVAVMANQQLEVDLPTLVVADTTKSLGQLAAYWREQFEMPVIGVTGSNGKTTVREMIARILEVDGPTLAAKDNLNNHIGVPLTLLQLRDFHRYSVVEMGMNNPGEIGYLSKIARPTVAVITNAAPAHLEGLGSVTGVARAKGEIFLGLEKEGVAVINADDRFAAYWLARGRRHKIITFGIEKQAQVRGKVKQLSAGVELSVEFPNAKINITLKLLGIHNARNGLAAAAAAWALGCRADQIKEGLEQVRPVNRRLQPILGKKKAQIIDDSYNANPDSMNCAIEVLSQMSGDRILVIGDMAELGSESESSHRAIGVYARKRGIDRLLSTGSHASLAGEEFGAGSCHYENIDKLSDAVIDLLAPGVNVLVKGSRSAGMERVVEAITEVHEENKC
ncbi:MAG: UDP-N-acetylmuramoyl-tripeptide--D-alanyl-D-alanine ligase [Acidiferrobacteraceae bacterium]|nr:UDP-N-acetylmuramoyl-tripeptide--D-alanyl-D-alanine ligase [Acidiferrobacteraceae bacterium]